MVDEGLASGVLTYLGVHPEQCPQHPLQRRLLALPAVVEPVADQLHGRHHRRADGVHHVIGMTFQQSAEHQQPVERFALRLGHCGAQEPEDPGVVGAGSTVRRSLRNWDSRAAT